MAENRQLTLFSRAVLIAAAVGSVIGLWDVFEGVRTDDWAKVINGAILLLLGVAATWLFSRFGAAKR